MLVTYLQNQIKQRAASLHTPTVKALIFHIKPASFSLLGLGVLFLLESIVPHRLPPNGFFWSVPSIFVFWLRLIRQDHVITERFSLLACALSFTGFIAAAGLDPNKYPLLATAFTALGTFAGLCIFIRARDFFHYGFRERDLTLIGLLGMSVSALYHLSDTFLWQRMCISAAICTRWLLELLGLHVYTTMGSQAGKPSVFVHSDYFHIQIFQPCSGIEGIFIFIFLLSSILLLDWKLFKHVRLIELYLIGFIYMFAMNILRIATLFLVGHYTSSPTAPAWMADYKDLAVILFHSYIGVVYYLFAFAAFAEILYKFAKNTEKTA